MARSWLEVTTDEVQSKQGARERLAERRGTIAERARAVLTECVEPAFRAAADRGDWTYREDVETEWSVARCGIYGPGDATRGPRVAFFVAEFDAYQPLVVLRRKASGAGALPHSRTVGLDALDADTVEAFLKDA